MSVRRGIGPVVDNFMWSEKSMHEVYGSKKRREKFKQIRKHFLSIKVCTEGNLKPVNPPHGLTSKGTGPALSSLQKRALPCVKTEPITTLICGLRLCLS